MESIMEALKQNRDIMKDLPDIEDGDEQDINNNTQQGIKGSSNTESSGKYGKLTFPKKLIIFHFLIFLASYSSPYNQTMNNRTTSNTEANGQKSFFSSTAGGKKTRNLTFQHFQEK